MTEHEKAVWIILLALSGAIIVAPVCEAMQKLFNEEGGGE